MAAFIRSLIFTAPSKHTVVRIALTVALGGPSELSIAIGFYLIGFVSTANARIDINLERKICRYNGFCAVSTAVGGQMTF